MKAHQSTQVKTSELFFGVLMLIIIFFTSCNTAQASPKVSLESSTIEQTQEIDSYVAQTKEKEEAYFYQQRSFLPIPVLIFILLIISYGALNGSLYLVKEIKKQ